MVGFTSTHSLPNYSSTAAVGGGGDAGGGGAPAVDERLAMSSSLRQLRPPSDEAFWPPAPKSADSPPSLLWTTDQISDVDGDAAAEEPHETPMGACLLRWGTKRKVRYFERSREEPKFLDRMIHQEAPPPPPLEAGWIERQQHPEPPSSEPSSSISKAEEAVEEHQIERRYSPSSSSKMKKSRKKPRRDKGEVKEKKVKAEGEQEKRATGPRVDRWSAERYEAAEMKLVEVMKEKGGGLGSPILRQTLREEARRHIGDTGLLDHLLKHMVGMVVTGGIERFRRRHNAAGELEYWLEPAELAEIRCKAGVADPYWVPPPGWKLGDPTSVWKCTTECHQEMSRLREEVAYLKRIIAQLQKQERNTRPESDDGCDIRQTVCIEKNWGMDQDTQFMKDATLDKSGFTGACH